MNQQTKGKPENNSEVDPSTLISTILTTGRGTHSDLARTIYGILKDFPERRIDLLRQCAETFGFGKSSGELELPAANSGDLNRLAKKHARIVDGYLSSLVSEDLEENDFYARLMDFIDNPLFTTDEDKSFVLFWILIDKKIPYFRLPAGLRITEDQFNLLKIELNNTIKRIRFCLSKDYVQSTEQAEVVLNLVLSHEGRDERAVLMGYVIAYFEDEIQRGDER